MLYTYLLVTFAIVFWLFRVAVALTTTLNLDFFFEPLDVRIEIALSFVTLICLIFICRRSIIAGLVYLISYLGYFGVFAYKIISVMLSGEAIISMENYVNLVVSIAAILLALLNFLDIGLRK